MVIEKKDMVLQERENMRGGDGVVKLFHALPEGQLPPHIRLLSPIVLEKGCGIGDHAHNGETEVFYVVRGEGVYNDNGSVRAFREGDMSFTGSGAHHSVYNEKDDPLVLLAAIITE